MTIVRSLGISTLVALMSAHRAVTESRGAERFDQDAVQAIEAYLDGVADRPVADRPVADHTGLVDAR